MISSAFIYSTLKRKWSEEILKGYIETLPNTLAWEAPLKVSTVTPSKYPSDPALAFTVWGSALPLILLTLDSSTCHMGTNTLVSFSFVLESPPKVATIFGLLLLNSRCIRFRLHLSHLKHLFQEFSHQYQVHDREG